MQLQRGPQEEVSGQMLTGPDVSEHQGNVDWEKVAKDHDLAIVRVADGDDLDPWYTEERIRAVREAGLLLAPYYFARVALNRDGRPLHLLLAPR